MKITRLRLLGFKSFVDPTELIVERGLTGVVGPNGCGKSNLLEALRWVMGETSYKSMRAAAMDDVIFSGTNNSPARSSAEVTMFLDNSDRQAPAEFNDTDVLEVTRRIEREAGSAYRINNREVRARDVKVLFEDASTGARSPALVRQGQIGELVNAKPEQRRKILEDAAGIAGLHTRRHEAELRLRAAQGNLDRLSDVIGQLTSQTESLKRQVRQARRYKEISGDIQRYEALALHLAWQDADHAVEQEESALAQSLDDLNKATEQEAHAFNNETKTAEAIAPLRETEAEKAAAFTRLRLEQDSLQREADQAATRERELKERLQQFETDVERETSAIAEAKETLAHLEADLEAVRQAEQAAAKDEEAAREVLKSAEEANAIAENELSEITQQSAEARAKQKSLESDMDSRRNEVERLTRLLEQLDRDIEKLRSGAPDAEKLATVTERGQLLAQELTQIEADALAAEEATQAAQAEARARHDEAARVRLDANAFSTEQDTIAKLLTPANDGAFPPVVDHIRVSPGYETALGSALGDDLEASLSTDAPLHWRTLDVGVGDQPLPADAEPLANHVEAPAELARRLFQIGCVSREDGGRLQPHLKPGQRLVSKEGDLWRWDGFVAAADGVTPAVQRLAHKNRLTELDRKAAAVLAAAQGTIDAEKLAAEKLSEAQAEERRLRQLGREKQAELASLRQELTALEQSARSSETKLAELSTRRDRANEDLTAAQKQHVELEAHLIKLKEDTTLDDKLRHVQANATQARQAVSEARVAVGGLERDREIRAERLRRADADIKRWNDRLQSAESQLTKLKTRLDDTKNELSALAGIPEQIAQKRASLQTALTEAEKDRQVAADALAEAENTSRMAAQALRQLQAEVATHREAKVRIETRLEAARQSRQEESRRIRDTFEVSPENCLSLAERPEAEEIAPRHEVDQKLSRLKSDRERLGGVNLQADEDLEAVGAQLEGITAERDDVEQAIAKLRGAISQLNREGKTRLDEAFKAVNGHFSRLFTTLFGGGEARLEMIESPDDPLEGGLEIIAKPPGKKPATLSLLSGGEQTLTALSLIFAVFLTNPAPICVLDEVDAPLDDSNVERFCRLMDQMASETDTRFLVITHHPMTMARMDRLFGVTMAERGVSQLVSVDLQTAQSFRETA